MDSRKFFFIQNGFCEQCLKCGEEVPIMNMPQHIECCSVSIKVSVVFKSNVSFRDSTYSMEFELGMRPLLINTLVRKTLWPMFHASLTFGFI